MAVSFVGGRGANFIAIIVGVVERGESGDYCCLLKIVTIAMMAEDIILIGRLPIGRSAV
jgi:hypothetical protein